jgi:NNP family nitrate/nitrite transporter-like MFS transporter
MGVLGAGNGIVFQLIPQRFQHQIGVVTGIVGAAGGMGGFLLPSALGIARQATGSFAPGLLAFAAAAAISAIAVALFSRAPSAAPDTSLEPVPA